MDATVLNGAGPNDPVVDEVAAAIARILEQSTGSFQSFRLRDMDIRACRSCGSCAISTPGECVIRDDMLGVLRSAARNPLWILLTPVTFGAYSSHLKKAVDRLMVMGLPLYMMRHGHMLHPQRYGTPQSLLVVGVLDDGQRSQADAFRKLASRNALNMVATNHSCILIDPASPAPDRERRIREALGEVGWR